MNKQTLKALGAALVLSFVVQALPAQAASPKLPPIDACKLFCKPSPGPMPPPPTK